MCSSANPAANVCSWPLEPSVHRSFVDFALRSFAPVLFVFSILGWPDDEICFQTEITCMLVFQRAYVAVKKCLITMQLCTFGHFNCHDIFGVHNVILFWVSSTCIHFWPTVYLRNQFSRLVVMWEHPQFVFAFCQQAHSTVHSSAPAFCSAIGFTSRRGPWVHREFDSTLGFPGEGPDPPTRMKCVSSNIGSLQTNPSWKTWDADVICLQETRVGKNNHRNAKKLFQTVGFTSCLGDLLPGKWHAKGSTQTPCGGTAIAGGSSYIRPFAQEEDQTGLYKQLFGAKRVVAAWIQVTCHKHALFLSVYATTGASNDARIHAENNTLFDMILTFVAQFGQVPVIIAGDFQALPSSYPILAHAFNFQSWFDPITTTDCEGHLVRPLTFSQDGAFSGPNDGCSSIDAVLLNSIAFNALHDARVLEHFGRQRRPIQITFEWPSIEQHGFILFKTAPFVLDHVSEKDRSNEEPPLWAATFRDAFHQSESSDEKWSIVNDFLQKSLLSRGAVWGNGPQQRARPFCQ